MHHSPRPDPTLHALFDPDVMGEDWPEPCGCLNCARTGQTLTPLQVSQLYAALQAEGRDPGQEIQLAVLRTFHPEIFEPKVKKATWRDRVKHVGWAVWFYLGY